MKPRSGLVLSAGIDTTNALHMIDDTSFLTVKTTSYGFVKGDVSPNYAGWVAIGRSEDGATG
jgi:hypothetical protein